MWGGGLLFFFSSRRRHTRCSRDWSSDVCSSDLIVAGPLNAAEFLKTLVTHARMHRTQRTQLVPNRLRIRFAPIAAKPLRQFVDDFHVVAHVVGQRHGGAHALHAALDRKSTRLNSSHGYNPEAV